MRISGYIAVVVCIVCICVAFCVFGEDRETEICRRFLEEYGWQTVEKPTDSAEVNIPTDFDMVYENYNTIQREAGLDLRPCRGRKGIRYTFEVVNYPIDTGETVYANVICIDGKPVGGDVMTVGINGFMHSLNRKSIEDA